MNFEPAVKAALEGSQEGFDFLYQMTFQEKYYVALKYMKNEADAQDVLQDAYVKAFQNLSSLKEPNAFSGWLGRIVANTAKTALMKKKAIPFSDMGYEAEDGDDISYDVEDDRMEYQPEEKYTSQETKELVGELLESLSDEQRVCVVMFHLEGFSLKEIAEVTNCSENTVKSRLNYGRKSIGKRAGELKKQGCKIYSVAPIPLLLYLLRLEMGSQGFAVSVKAAQVASAGAIQTKLATATSGAAKMTGTKAATSGTAKSIGKGAALKGLTGKAVAGIVTVAVVGGVAGGVVGKNLNKPQTTTQVQQSATTTEQKRDKTKELKDAYGKVLDQLAGTYNYYGVYDINQDGIPELIAGKEDGYEYVHHVYTAVETSSGYESKKLSGEFYLGAVGKVGVGSLHMPESGPGLLIKTMQGGTGEESVYQVTMEGNTIVSGTKSIMNFTAQTSEEQNFDAKNKNVTFKDNLKDKTLLESSIK